MSEKDKYGRRRHIKKEKKQEIPKSRVNPLELAAKAWCQSSSRNQKSSDQKNIDYCAGLLGAKLVPCSGQKINFPGQESHHYLVTGNTNPRLPDGRSANVQRLYHGTSLQGLSSIVYMGKFIPSAGGLLGPGIYLGPLSKAQGYANKYGVGGALLACDVVLGEEGIDYKAGRAGITKTWGGTLLQNEYCVINPCQVVIRELWIITAKHFRCGGYNNCTNTTTTEKNGPGGQTLCDACVAKLRWTCRLCRKTREWQQRRRNDECVLCYSASPEALRLLRRTA